MGGGVPELDRGFSGQHRLRASTQATMDRSRGKLGYRHRKPATNSLGDQREPYWMGGGFHCAQNSRPTVRGSAIEPERGDLERAPFPKNGRTVGVAGLSLLPRDRRT